MTEWVLMLAILRSTEVIGRPLPLATCLAVQAEVVESHTTKRPVFWHLPGKILRETQMIDVICVREQDTKPAPAIG